MTQERNQMNANSQITIDANRLSLDQALQIRAPEVSQVEVLDLIKHFNEGVADLLLTDYDQRELRVTKDKIRRVLRCERNLVESQASKDKPTPAMVAGTLLDACFTLHASGGVLEDPTKDALLFLSTLGDGLDIDPDVEDLVRPKVEEGYAKLVAFWDADTIRDKFSLRLQDRIALSFRNTRLQLIGRPDVVLSGLDPNHEDVVIIDVKSGTPKIFDVEDARLYALMETLRSHRLPSLIGNYYLAIDRLELIVPSLQLLGDETSRTLGAIAKMVEIANTKSATTTRSVELCQYCPINLTCAEVTEDDRLGWASTVVSVGFEDPIESVIGMQVGLDD